MNLRIQGLSNKLFGKIKSGIKAFQIISRINPAATQSLGILKESLKSIASVFLIFPTCFNGYIFILFFSALHQNQYPGQFCFRVGKQKDAHKFQVPDER